MENLNYDSNLIELIKSFKKEIVERKWAEKKANDALDYAESILDSVPSPIIVLDDDYKIVSVNMPFFQLFNLTIEQSIGKMFFEISDGLFNIELLKELVRFNDKEIQEMELFQNFKIIGKKYLQIKCINLQYNVKHLKFKLIIINDITDLKKTLEDLKNKHMLLNDLHHRTKNNLMMVEGILKLQLNSVEDPKLKEFLMDNLSRISAITNIHMILNQSDNYEKIDFNLFINNLVENIKDLYSNSVAFEIDITDIFLTFNQGIYLGIVINEIITNSFKYAFKNPIKEPKIKVSIKKIENNTKLLCIVSDNGEVNHKEFAIDHSLGFNLIENIIQLQLKGSWKFEYNNGLFHEIILDYDQEAVERGAKSS